LINDGVKVKSSISQAVMMENLLHAKTDRDARCFQHDSAGDAGKLRFIAGFTMIEIASIRCKLVTSFHQAKLRFIKKNNPGSSVVAKFLWAAMLGLAYIVGTPFNPG
jgi:hypothetical protein